MDLERILLSAVFVPAAKWKRSRGRSERGRFLLIFERSCLGERLFRFQGPRPRGRREGSHLGAGSGAVKLTTLLPYVPSGCFSHYPFPCSPGRDTRERHPDTAGAGNGAADAERRKGCCTLRSVNLSNSTFKGARRRAVQDGSTGSDVERY